MLFCYLIPWTRLFLKKRTLFHLLANKCFPNFMESEVSLRFHKSLPLFLIFSQMNPNLIFFNPSKYLCTSCCHMKIFSKTTFLRTLFSKTTILTHIIWQNNIFAHIIFQNNNFDTLFDKTTFLHTLFSKTTILTQLFDKTFLHTLFNKTTILTHIIWQNNIFAHII
jgi:hypothetical protein